MELVRLSPSAHFHVISICYQEAMTLVARAYSFTKPVSLLTVLITLVRHTALELINLLLVWN